MKKFGIPDFSRSPGQGTASDISPASRRLSATKAPPRSVFYLIGSIGGVLGGVLGIGGGSAISPLLLLAGGLKPAQIAGTTLATVLVISAVGSGAYASIGLLNLELAWPIAMGSATAAVLGALAAKRLSMRLMISMFILILPYFAAMELWPSFAAPELSTNFVWLVALGGATGFMSGLLGISGASLVVPSLVAFFLLDHHAAQGIAISVALADSIAGTATHAKHGNIDYSVLRRLAGPAVVAALIGSFLSGALPESVLRILFAVFMLATSVMLVVRLVRGNIEAKAVSPQSTTGKQGSPPITRGLEHVTECG